jgi:hypothetical protein
MWTATGEAEYTAKIAERNSFYAKLTSTEANEAPFDVEFTNESLNCKRVQF